MTVTVTAVAPSLIRQSSQISGFALVTLFSLSGLVLSLVLVTLGFDLGAGTHDGLIVALGFPQQRSSLATAD
jgi:hypothetical protein